MGFFYQVAIFFYGLILRLASFFNPKAKLWVSGRKDWRMQYAEKLRGIERPIWLHSASLGEFEQGRPVLEALRKRFPKAPIVLTFFSPSGFEIRKEWDGADVVLYLPLDTQKNAVDFIKLLNPRVAIFVKYEFWMNLLGVLKGKAIPTVLVSGIFRSSHVFLKPYGGWFRSKMQAFSHAFMQNEESCVLASEIGVSAELSGDTRFDRVLDIASHSFSVEIVKTFKGESVCIVAGSSWGPEEKALLSFAKENPSVKVVIVPHEIGEGHLQQIEASYGKMISRFSEVNKGKTESSQVLLVDQMGLLSRIFREADIALIGGGFGAGIHNTLEAAVYGVPVVFGPNYKKFIEAKGLIANGGAVSVQEPHKLINVLEALVNDDVQRKEMGAKAKAYVAERSGATLQVVSYLVENELV